MSENLLDTLSNSQLPSTDREPTEPQPIDSGFTDSPAFEEGRKPEEVVQSREVTLPAAEREQTYEIRGIKYTAAELEKAGLLEDLATTHNKHAHLQQKYQQLLEQQAAAAETQRAEQAQAPAPQITNLGIARVYDEVATAITNDLIHSNLLELDLPEAYPRAVQTLVGQLRFAFDKIFDIESKVMPLIGWLQQAQARAWSQGVATAYYQQLDALVASDPQFYAGLKSQKTRDAFTQFLVQEVNANIGQATGEGAQTFLAKQWTAFNSGAVIDAAKRNVAERTRAASRRFVGGESTGSRSGRVDTGGESMLDRMITNSGKISE